MNLTVDPILMQVVNFVDENITEKSDLFRSATAVDRAISILHFMESVDLACRGCINDVDKEHWYPSQAAFSLMDIGGLASKSRTVPYLVMISESENWLQNNQSMISLCKHNVEREWFQTSLRSVGALLLSVAEKHLSLLGPEDDGGIVFKITEKGERVGLGPLGCAFHFSLTASKSKSNPVYECMKDWRKEKRSSRVQGISTQGRS